MTLSVDWDASAKTGPDILADVLAMKQASIDAKFYGPFVLYVPTAYETVLDEDFSTLKGDITVRDRLLRVSGIDEVKVVDTMTANTVVLVQMTADVVREVIGLPLQTVEWETNGGMITHFNVVQIMVPQIRSDQSGNCGVTVLS